MRGPASSAVVASLFVLSTAAANVFQKKGMTLLGPVTGFSRDLLLRAAAIPWVWLGIASWGVALVMYLVLLSRVPLNVAASIAALNFVAVLVASRVVLGEPIPAARYAGFLLILAGVWIVTWTAGGSR